MSTENAASSPESAGAEASSLQAQVTALENALSATRKTRLLILGLLVLLVVGIGIMFKGVMDRLQSPEYLNDLGAKAREHLDENSQEYMGHVEKLVEKVTPELTRAFYGQVQKDTPEYMRAVQREREQLMQNVQAQLEERINRKYKETLAKYESILKEEFPKAEDDIVRKRLMANMEQSLQKMVKEFYVDAFEREFKALADTWDTFPQAPPLGPDEEPYEKQLMGVLMEIVVLQASGRGSLASLAEEGGETGEGANGTPEPNKPDEASSNGETSETDAPSEDSDSDSNENKEADSGSADGGDSDSGSSEAAESDN